MNHRRLTVALLLTLLLTATGGMSTLYAQTTQGSNNPAGKERKGYTVGYIIENGTDTLFVDKLSAIYVFNRPESWKKSKNWREYYRTVYNFKKVYPYALRVKEIVLDAETTIAESNFTPREKRKYLEKYERRLIKEFEKPMKNLTLNQGKLLMRLVDREVGLNSFYLIKNYYGGATAGFWQGIAKLFGADLKKPYDKFGEDRLVEELVLMYQNGTFNYLYYSMFTK